MRVQRTTLLFAIFTVALVSGAFVTGVYAGFKNRPEVDRVTGLINKEYMLRGEMAQSKESQEKTVDFEPFWAVWNAINDKYTSSREVPTDQEKVWGAIEGLAAALDDPYSQFYPPKAKEQLDLALSGNFEGVGMEIGLDDDNILVVIAPLRGTPAERAGVLPGDQIIAIDAMPTINQRIEESVQMIRGEKGTVVTLTIVRENKRQPFDITITRDVIDLIVIDTEVLVREDGSTTGGGSGLRSDGVFVIHLFGFTQESPQLFGEALDKFIEAGTDKLIIDLRGNPGGFLEAAVDIASWFLPEGSVIVREDGGLGVAGNVYRSKGYDIFNDNLKLVVLVNEGSASASEILAGALREHGIATLVGAKTFGKGSVQELIEITHNTALKLTVAQWLTPEGVSISDGGLTPDIEVEMTYEDLEAGNDLQLEAALDVVLSKK